ncbi:stAR-related lipid transfer protein 9 isoform X2 [Corythoichthys intestinalis]|uniref:stAR-related lipid transfer protein 9 isoform X2 n=1 Tax=Corythoichthys intestinalis TaxID=161448 RepID=UPI0025A4D212|nr:stAR-related lipid transfer protein 9 isoform X2 [Corythoichthys intestinalis]
MANVKVAVRVRPLNARERADGGRLAVHVDDKFVRIQNVKLDPRADHAVDSREKLLEFHFDYCYWSVQPEDPHYASQEEVFQDLGVSVLAGASEGYNVCLFAYGQTGSGKTYTMMGTPDCTGLTPRICQGLFRSQDPLSDGQNSSRVEISFLEIYNERVRDLLSSSEQKKRTSLRVREHPEKGPYVQDLSQHVVSDYQQAVDLLEAGIANRITAATHNHDASSRSHAIFTIQYTQAILESNRPSETVSKINLVDLAGSERADPNYCRDRLTEGSNINKSLVTLGIVISALAQNSQMSSSCQSINSMASEGDGSTAGSHSSFPSTGGSAGRRHCFIPYRDSVLTWLLKDSLGGNSKTIMIATVSPSASSYNETLSTLRYAAHARNIVNKPRVNEDANVRLIRELREEIERLKSMLLTFGMQRDPSPSLSDEKEGTLSDMVLQNELKVEQLTKDWSESWRNKRELLEQYSVDINQDRAGFLINSPRPHLVALDGDVLSTGVVFYHLMEGVNHIGPRDHLEEPQIGLASCEIHNDSGVVTLRPLPGCACLINDREVTEPCRLAQGMVITLGGLHKFRFNHPVEAAVLRERRRASESTDIDLSLPTPDQSKKEGLPAVSLSPDEESSARRRVEEQQCYVEGLRQEMRSEQRRAERELEMDQAHLRHQHNEIHQWIMQEKRHLGIQTDPQPDPFLERLTGFVPDDQGIQSRDCPSMVFRVRKKVVQEELLKHHALCRAESRFRRKKLQFQLERIARKRHLLEAKRELQRLEKGLPPSPESPEEGSPPKFLSPRHSFSADLVSRLYPQHTPIFRHFLKRNKSTDMNSNSTSPVCLTSRKWVSDECLPRERTQSCSGPVPSGLNQACQGSSRSKDEENSQERPCMRCTERKPLLPQRQLSFKNRSDHNAAASPKLPVCITVQPLGKENVACRTDIPIIPNMDVKIQTQCSVTRKSFSSSVGAKASGNPSPRSNNTEVDGKVTNQFPGSNEDSGVMRESTIKTVSLEELEKSVPLEVPRRWHSTEALMNKTGQWVERQQRWKYKCEWKVEDEQHDGASDSESLFSLDSLSSVYATALAQKLKCEEEAPSEADSEDSKMSKDSLALAKYSSVKYSCQKVDTTYSLVTDSPRGNRIVARGEEWRICQEPKVDPAQIHSSQQDSLKLKPEFGNVQKLIDNNICQTSVAASPIAGLSENLQLLVDVQSSCEVANVSGILRDSPSFRKDSSEHSNFSDGLSPSRSYNSTSISAKVFSDQLTVDLMSQNEKGESNSGTKCLIADPLPLPQKFKDDVGTDMYTSGCQAELHLLTNFVERSQAFTKDSSSSFEASQENEVLHNLDVTLQQSDTSGHGIIKDHSLAKAESQSENDTKDVDAAFVALQSQSVCKNSRKRNREQQEACEGKSRVPKRSSSPVDNQGDILSDSNNTFNSKKEHHDLEIFKLGFVSTHLSPQKLEESSDPSVGEIKAKYAKKVVANTKQALFQIDNAERNHSCQSKAICSAIDLRISEVVQEHLKLALFGNSSNGHSWSQRNWSQRLVSDCDDQRKKQINNNTLDNTSDRMKDLPNNGETAEKKLRASEVKTVPALTKVENKPTGHEMSDSCTSGNADASQPERFEDHLPKNDCSKDVYRQSCSEALNSVVQQPFQIATTKGTYHVESMSNVNCGHSCDQQLQKEVVHPQRLSSDGGYFHNATQRNKHVKEQDQHSSPCLNDRCQACVANRDYNATNKCQGFQCNGDKAQVKHEGPCVINQSEVHVPESFAVLKDEIKVKSSSGSEMANVGTQCQSSLLLKKNKSKRFRRTKITCPSSSPQTLSSDEDQTSSKQSSSQLKLDSEDKTNVRQSNTEISKVNSKMELIKQVSRKRLSLPSQAIPLRTNDCQNAVNSQESQMHFVSSDINPFIHQWQDYYQPCCKNHAFGSANDLSHKSPLTEKRITRCCSVDNGLNRQNSPFNSHLSTYAAHKGLSSTLSSIEQIVNTTSSSGFANSSDPELGHSVTQKNTNEHGLQTELVLPTTTQRKERHKRSHTDIPKSQVQINKSLTWTSMENMSVHLSKLIHSTSDLLGDVQGLRMAHVSGLSPRSISNVSLDCSTQTALDVGVQTERPSTPENTNKLERSKSHEVNVTLRVIGAEVVSRDKDSLCLMKTETVDKEDGTLNFFQPGTASLKSQPVGCRRQLRSSSIKKILSEKLHHHNTTSENCWNPSRCQKPQTPLLSNPSKPATTFTDRASSPIVTFGVNQQLKPRQGDLNGRRGDKSFTESSYRSSGLNRGICSGRSPEKMIRSSRVKETKNYFQSSSMDRRNTPQNGSHHPQPKQNTSQSPNLFDFSPQSHTSATGRKTDNHDTKSKSVQSTVSAQLKPQVEPFGSDTCSTSPAASLTPSECSTDVLVNCKPITCLDTDKLPEDLPLHNKFTNWSGINSRQSRYCVFSDAAEISTSNSDMRLREIEHLRQEREQVMASVGLCASSTPLTVELTEAKLHYGLGETDALLKMLSPRSTEELKVNCSTATLGKKQLQDRHRSSFEGFREHTDESPQTSRRTRSLSPSRRHPGSPPATPNRQSKPDTTRIRVPVGSDGTYPSDIEQMLRDYGRAREEAMGEIAKARERLRERTEQEKRRLLQQSSSVESTADPRHGTRISNSTLCTGSSLSLSSGPTSGYNSGNTLQLQHSNRAGYSTTCLEENENVASRRSFSAQNTRIEPLMTSSPSSPPSCTRRRSASFGSSCSSLSTSYQDVTAALLGQALAEVRLASCGDLGNLMKGKASAGWRHQGEERGIQAYYRASSSPSMHAFLGAAELDGPPEHFWAVLHRPGNVQFYHPSVRTAWTRPLDDSTHLVYILTDTSSCHLNRPRDFCCISAESKQGDVHVLAMQSVLDESLPRPGPEAVRGQMMPSCWLVRPIKRDGSVREATRVVFLQQVDLGTPSFPPHLLGAVARKQVTILADLADVVAVSWNVKNCDSSFCT